MEQWGIWPWGGLAWGSSLAQGRGVWSPLAWVAGHDLVWSEMGEGTSVGGVWASKCSTMLMCSSMWAPLNVEDNVGPPLTRILVHKMFG